MDELVNEILEDLIVDIGIEEDTGSSKILLLKIKDAYRTIKGIREYPESYSDEMINKDMKRYYSNIRDLALYDYNQRGVEGQTSHSENGTSRNWKDRNDCLKGVTTICKVI